MSSESKAVRDALRDVGLQLALLNHQVGGRLEIRDADLDCLNLVSLHGPLAPGALARLAGLHPATMTGVLDRLEKAGWVARERDPQDRRGLRVRAVRERAGEILKAYQPMNRAMEEVCATYTPDQLTLIADFLHRTAAAGRDAAEQLISPR